MGGQERVNQIVSVFERVGALKSHYMLGFVFLALIVTCPTYQHSHAVFWRVRIYLIRAKSSGPEGGLFCPAFPLSPSLPLSLPSFTFSPQSPRAETLMKTNARNQFEASSFHLAGARLCTSISTPAGGELLQSSPITHTSVLRSRYGLQATLREECIKTGAMCNLKLS